MFLRYNPIGITQHAARFTQHVNNASRLDVVELVGVFWTDVAAVEDDFALEAIRILADRPPLDGEA